VSARKLTIVGLGGSLAKVSKSRVALRLALAGAEAADAATELLDLRELDLPLYNPDDAEPGEAAARVVESCYAADGLIWSSPLYQGSISGSLKNALDWLHLLRSRDPSYLHDKVIGLISAAGGTQGLQAINTMEFAVRALRGWAVPYVVPVPRPGKPSATTGRSRIGRLRSSSRRSGRRLFVWPRGSRATSRPTIRPSAITRPNASPQPSKSPSQKPVS
jgi:FMN reductase